MILLLSGDISLNPGQPHNSQIDSLSWNVFDKKGLHFLYINVNSLLLKIEEIRFIAKKSEATVIRISETKLDGVIFYIEVYIKGYSIVGFFSIENILSKKVEVIFVDLFLPKTKPISVSPYLYLKQN